jgi:uncharacterized protein YigE (DUF2233 family)
VTRGLGLVAAAIWLSVANTGATEDASRTRWTTLAPGLWYREWSFETGADRSEATAHVFRADPRLVRITVIDARRRGRDVAPVSTLREESGAYLVVNGSFFDERGRPLGLVVRDGKELSALRRVDQGVFFIKEGKAAIQHTRDALPNGLETAVQAGPRLVVEGRPLRLKQQVSRRTCVCLPGDGNVLFVVLHARVSLIDLARELSRPAVEGGLGCWSALNLDGGPSTQLSVATDTMPLEIEGGWGVPNGLAVLPK